MIHGIVGEIYYSESCKLPSQLMFPFFFHKNIVQNFLLTHFLFRIFQGFCEAIIPLVSNPQHLKTIISCITAVIPSSTVPNSVSTHRIL